MASEEGAEQIEVEVMDEVAAAGEEEGGNGMVMIIGGLLCVVVVIILVVVGLWAGGMFGGPAKPCSPKEGNKCADQPKDKATFAKGEKSTTAEVAEECGKQTDDGKCSAVMVNGDACCQFKAEAAGDKPA